MTIRANLPTEHEGRTGPTTNVVELDATGARRRTQHLLRAPASAPPGEQHAAFHSNLNFARKAYDEGDIGTALIHLNAAARILTEPAA